MMSRMVYMVMQVELILLLLLLLLRGSLCPKCDHQSSFAASIVSLRR